MKKGKFVGLCIFIFVLTFILGIISKFAIQPSWKKEYSVKWSDEIGTRISDVSYDTGEANKFDLYLPKDNTKKNYGLVVYLHAGGFTTGDKTDDDAYHLSFSDNIYYYPSYSSRNNGFSLRLVKDVE